MTGRGRRARRTIKAALAPAWIELEGAAQVALPLPVGNTGHPDTNDLNTVREWVIAWRARAQP